MKLVYPFVTDETPGLAQVGGKAMSLISMTRHGLPVPAGFVLTVAFFQPWLEYIQATPEWTQVLRSSPEERKPRCDALKARCASLELDDLRRQALAEALAALRTAGGTRLFAVRSSSPEEDLEELSFAGGYETVLGVTEEALEDALRRSFASCLDARVFVYKQEHGLAVDQPRIAVIVQQVFDLTMDDLDKALADPALDLRALSEQNTRFLSRLKRVREFPRVVDSRGKIFRAPRREAREGELAGQPISPGVVRGPVKVLHAPDEKPLLPGDVMVTRATDPGWTPLFINASGIILEVGGLLQHGALVAREYGKPCIAGIENVTAILKDGQEIEMDGASGVVRLV